MHAIHRKQARKCRNAMARAGVTETAVFKNGVNQAMRDSIRESEERRELRKAGNTKAIVRRADWWFNRTEAAGDFHAPEGGRTASTGKGGNGVSYRDLMQSL